MEDLDWIQSYENTSLFQIILNILLVSQDVRRATLIEWNNFTKEEREIYETLGNQFISDLGLSTFPDPLSDHRIFVVKDKNIKLPKTDQDIANLLEFVCEGHDYENQDKHRISGHIIETNTNAMIYAEVCEQSKMSKDKLEKYLRKKASQFNDAMERLGLKYTFDYFIDEIIPRKELLQNFTDQEYVSNHLNAYIQLLYNEFYDKTRFVKKPELVMERFDIFNFIMEMIKNGDIDKLYKQVTPLSKEYDVLLVSLSDFESQLFQT
jgi:hypothetical protein